MRGRVAARAAVASSSVSRRLFRSGEYSQGLRALAEETPVALVHDASTTAVMMATPADIEDFAVGFSLTEGIIAGVEELDQLEIVTSKSGIEARMWLRPGAGGALSARRRQLVGPTGCGLCGLDSLEAAVRLPASVGDGTRVTSSEIYTALRQVTRAQRLGQRTHAVHAAALWSRESGLVALREDVGRHNALDKLVGAVRRSKEGRAGDLVVITSRVSVDMVQKCAALGSQVLVAVSAPTTLAVHTAEAAGLTLVAVARDDGFEVFTRPDRVIL